ncbi:vanin-like protein 1 [Monomorium pharaonis]|uniref:vanin-like protein 1 n=1 Tax=Monomorium pharaonis TaxID=307658 RepID=UPI00063F1901|nr:vanin-like protein 1 [Monomorium pharaonis]XP_036140737.1 vanin-like protein 1 [Monomorium pharaonis]
MPVELQSARNNLTLKKLVTPTVLTLIQMNILQKQFKLSNMNRHWIIGYLLVVCAHLSHQRSTLDATTYVAAVVEYPSKYLTNISETLKVNSDAYVRLITKAGHLYKADIIVFPEDGLTSTHLPEREEMEDWTTIIPSASDNYTPCTQNTVEVSEALKKISCAASDNEIYVVINIAEKAACNSTPCPKDKIFYYNSNVVFDRTGKIIARYRKVNLFATEPQFNVTPIPEVVTFDTDFGVKFGTFICFDILFREPALQLTREHKVTDIVYPTAWYSEAPFLTAVQTQAGWSFAEDVNLLASGYNRPDVGNVGSGIYLGRKGDGIAIMPNTIHEEILIFNVPKIKKKSRYEKNRSHSKKDELKAESYHNGKEYIHEELRKKQKNNITYNDKIFLLHEDIYAFETVSLKERSFTGIIQTVCQNDFCCEFTVEITKVDPNTKYRLVVFNGIRRYVAVKAKVRVCGIVQCSSDSILSCGSVQESNTVFSNIEIVAKFHNYKNNLIMPSTLGSDLLPLKDWTFNEYTHDNNINVNMFLNNDTNNLVTFGIYSRDFNTNTETRTYFYIIVYIVALLLTFLFKLH